MSTITVSIGRNTSTGPMADDDWQTFRVDVDEAVGMTGHRVLFAGTGAGIWEGQVEEAFTVVAMTTGSSDTDTLTRYLADLARIYGQDAIAITTGETVLAGMQHSTSV